MLNVCLEYKLQDTWIGIFWKNSETVMPQGAPSYALPICKLFDLWICIVPCFPIQIQYINSQPIKESLDAFKQHQIEYNQKKGEFHEAQESIKTIGSSCI
jgi:hypothetical protein